MEKVGIVFGCFIPLHLGHMTLIEQALKENDIIILGICGYDKDRGASFIPFRDRIHLIKEKYKEDKRVKFAIIDDKKIGLTGTFSEEAWRIWGKELFETAEINPDDRKKDFTWYTGEESYIEKLKIIYPAHNFCKLDRTKINISGTEIRNNPEKNKENIDEVFRKYLENNHIL